MLLPHEVFGALHSMGKQKAGMTGCQIDPKSCSYVFHSDLDLGVYIATPQIEELDAQGYGINMIFKT